MDVSHIRDFFLNDLQSTLMKKTIAALLALSGLAVAESFSQSADVLNNTYGTIISSRANNALVATQVISASSTYTDLVTNGVLAESGKWYVTSSYNVNVDGYSADSGAITLVSGGPTAYAIGGAIKFDVSADVLQNCGNTFALTFDIKLSTSGPGSKEHTYNFSLLSEDFRVDSVGYTNNALSTNDWTTVELTFNADQLAELRSTGTDQTLVLLASTPGLSGSNKGVLMSNFKYIPEPGATTLSLLALAGLAVRRRRR